MKNLALRPGRWALGHRRQVAFCLFLVLLLVLCARPSAHASDVFNNIGPAPQVPPGGWFGRYPLNNYSLDEYFSAISVGFTSGVDASGVAPMIAYFGAQVLWQITSFVATCVILLFALAFNLDLVNGNGTPGSGALAPVSQAIHNLYTSTFGTPWLIGMVALVGCWAMWKALIQRRYTETASALAVSLLFFVLAIGIVAQPERTIGPASKLSNHLSTALLSLTSEGSVTSESQAKTGAANQLFELLVLNPWTALEFGGIEHCATVSHGKPHSVPVRPLSGDLSTDTRLAVQLEHGTEVTSGGKTCINNRNKYARHFLPFPPGSDRRGAEHEALEHGDNGDLPASDTGKTDGTYPLGPADEPAAEAMGKGGQYQRLLLAIVILLGEIGAFLLLGALAVGVILAQILLLTLLGFAPVALLIGIFPGRGHDFFRRWLTKLASYLARKVVYSLILALVLAVCSALDSATSNLGWLLAFCLQVAFLWTVFIQRNKLASDLLASTLGPGAARDDTNRLQALYYSTRLARTLSLGRGGGRHEGGEKRTASAPHTGPGGPPPPDREGSSSNDPSQVGPGDDESAPATRAGEPNGGPSGTSGSANHDGGADGEVTGAPSESAEPTPVEHAAREAADSQPEGEAPPRNEVDRAQKGGPVRQTVDASSQALAPPEQQPRDARPAEDQRSAADPARASGAEAPSAPAVVAATAPPEAQGQPAPPAPPEPIAVLPAGDPSPSPASAAAAGVDRIESDSSSAPAIEPSTAAPSATAAPVAEALRERYGDDFDLTTSKRDAPA